MRAHLFDLQPPECAHAPCEAHRLVDRERFPRALLQRAQRLFQDVAVNLDPAVAEEDERRFLLQQEADLLRAHRLAIDLDDEPGRNRRGGRRGRLLRQPFADFRFRRHLRREVHARDLIARLHQLPRAASNKTFRFRPREFDCE